LGKVAEIKYVQNASNAPKSATAVVEELEIFIPLDGNIDVNSELTRLKKEISKLTKEISGLEKKLKNESFLKNAPALVISKEKDKLSGMSSKIEKLKERVAELC
jgi:valyl-tRNA synthetase